MTTINKHPSFNALPPRLTRRDKEVLNFVFSRQDEGASIQRVAANLKLTHTNVKHVFAHLIKIGEIYRRKNAKGDGVYCATAWTMAFNPKPLVEKLHENLKRDLFGEEITPELRSFLSEFSSGVKLGLSVDESFLFAKEKLERLRKESNSTLTRPMEV